MKSSTKMSKAATALERQSADRTLLLGFGTDSVVLRVVRPDAGSSGGGIEERASSRWGGAFQCRCMRWLATSAIVSVKAQK